MTNTIDIQPCTQSNNNITVSYINCTAPDVIEVPRDIYEEVLNQLDCYKSVLISEREVNAIEVLHNTINKLKSCDRKSVRNS